MRRPRMAPSAQSKCVARDGVMLVPSAKREAVRPEVYSTSSVEVARCAEGEVSGRHGKRLLFGESAAEERRSDARRGSSAAAERADTGEADPQTGRHS